MLTKNEPTEINDQQHKQPWRKPTRWTDMSLDQKTVKSIHNFDDGKPLRNANPGRLRDKEIRLIHIKPCQGNEFISENEDDEYKHREKALMNLSANAA